MVLFCQDIDKHGRQSIKMKRRKSYLHNYPVRLMAGAFILNSGIGKVFGEEATHEHVFSTAITAYPFLEPIGASKFAKLIGASEILIGAALLAPFVSDGTAGSLLLPFSIGLLGLYFKIPGMRNESSIRPTNQGISIAKDSWLFGIALSLISSRTKHRDEVE